MLNYEKFNTFLDGLLVGAYGTIILGWIGFWIHKKQEEKKVLKVANEVLKEVFPTGQPQIPEIKRAVLTLEMQKRGPIPDVPAIKWTSDALAMFLATQGLNPQALVKITKTPSNDLVFEQPVIK